MTAFTYRDFVIYVETEKIAGQAQPNVDDKGRPNRYSVRVFDSPAGEGEREEIVDVADWDQLEKWRQQLATRTSEPADLTSFACRLGEMLLPPYAHSLYRASYNALHEHDRLRLRLRLPPELAVWPWEYAIIRRTEGEPSKLDHIALDQKISVVRHVEIAVPAVPFATGKSRSVLVAMASPKPHTKYRKLKLREEQKQIKAAFDQVSGVEANYIPDYEEKQLSAGATEEELHQALHDPTDLFHFSGHGEFITAPGPLPHTIQGEGAIVLAKDDGSGEAISADRLSSLLVEGHVRAVVLDACESAEGDVFHKWSSVATSLLKNGIPAVIAMQFSVYDELGKVFASEFYQALVAGETVDQAVCAGRLAMWRHQENARDWGAPVLYLRNSGGAIFPPVHESSVLDKAKLASEQTATLNAAVLDWARQDVPITSAQLSYFQNVGETLQLTRADLLLLLRSALASGEETQPWICRLQQMGDDWIRKLDGQEPSVGEERAESKEKAKSVGQAERLLGLDNASLATHPPKIGAVTWSAVHHVDPLTRQTAALALLTLGVEETLKRLQDGLTKGIAPSKQRRQRRAELCGVLAETDDETAKSVNKQLDNVQDRYALWRWRARRTIQRNWQRICGWSVRGAVGGALALATYRALFAIPDRGVGGNPGIAFAIYSYWGFLLGLALIFALSMAAPLLLQNPAHPQIQTQRQVAMLALGLGALAFASSNVLVALLNGAGWNASWRTFPSALLVGGGLALGLWGQPRVGWHLGGSGWLKRLLPAFLLPALAQLPSLCEVVFMSSRQWLAASIFNESNTLVYGFSWIPTFQRLFDCCDPFNQEVAICCYQCASANGGNVLSRLFTNCLEQWLTVLDAGIVGLVLTLGISAALHMSTATFKRGRSVIGKYFLATRT